MRAHLARLTSELSSHQELLSELRSLRESDARTLREKSAEVERLRKEVERLAGEVEVLRGVVEEGLNERRAVREASTQADEEQEADEHTKRQVTENMHQSSQAESNADDAPLVHNQKPGNRTMRTDYATVGSSANAGTSTRPFIDEEELDRISLELAERRSDRSGASSCRSRLSDGGEQSLTRSRAPSPSVLDHTVPSISPEVSKSHVSEPPSRPPAPTPGIPGQLYRRSSMRAPKTTAAEQGSPSAPFPQIRGGHLEKLFFSAPEHNARTCTACHRPSRGAESETWPARKHGHKSKPYVDDAEDEGFVEGPEHADAKGKHREHVDPTRWKRESDNEGLPPQTVLARVLREIEDDFTHYKRCVLRAMHLDVSDYVFA